MVFGKLLITFWLVMEAGVLVDDLRQRPQRLEDLLTKEPRRPSPFPAPQIELYEKPVEKPEFERTKSFEFDFVTVKK